MKQAKKLASKPVVKSNNAHNTVRINAGTWRSRLLKFPDVDGLRPTPERVRQTVFNWLGQDLTGKTCLDLFAGTGAFGFEALSRNAKQVTMVELSRPAFQSLVQNQTLLQASQAQLLHLDALQFLNNNQQRFDVIFCDPPFHHEWLNRLLPLLKPHLSDEGLVYVEAEYEIKPDKIWQVIKQNKAGNVYYHLLKPVE